MDFATWSPFQSKQVREICAHMTTSERSRAGSRAIGYGLWVFATVAGPLGFGWWSAATPLRIAAGALLAAHVCVLPFWQRQARRFLCSTEWARAKGLMPEQLRLFEFRRENLRLSARR